MIQFQPMHKRLLKQTLNSLATKLSKTSKSALSNVDVARIMILGDGSEDYRIWKSTNNHFNIIVFYTFKTDKENALRVGYSMTVTTAAQPGYQIGGNGGMYVNIETKVDTTVDTKIIKTSEIQTSA